MQTRLYQLLKLQNRPLLLTVSEDGEVLQWEGESEFYGFTLRQDKTVLAELLPVLTGLELNTNPLLPFVNLQNGVVADIEIIKENVGYLVMLTDATARHHEQQDIQRVRNEKSILNAKLNIVQTELETTNQGLEIASNAKSRFIAGMSHEFRTPIMGMLGNIKRIKQQLKDSPPWVPSLNTVETNASYLLTLVENLLQQQKLDISAVSVNYSTFPVRALVGCLCDTLLPLAEAKSLKLSLELDFTTDLLIRSDDNNLRRALFNIIGNAIKFTDVGQVSVFGAHHDNTLVITVSDTGIGIAAEDLEKIFTPFQRGGNVSHKPGSGLGLAHAQGIAHVLGGDISVSSKTGVGTRITFTIEAPESDPAQVTVRESISLKVVNGSVLMIEDNEDLRQLYHYFFDQAGIELTTVSNSSEMIKVLPTIKPRLVFVDYMLENEFGIDLVRQLRAGGFSHEIVMLTASLDIEDSLRQKAFAVGCTDFMEKPANVDDLVVFTRKVLASGNMEAIEDM